MNPERRGSAARVVGGSRGCANIPTGQARSVGLGPPRNFLGTRLKYGH
jgi:hypothetical protein